MVVNFAAGVAVKNEHSDTEGGPRERRKRRYFEGEMRTLTVALR